MQSRIMETKTMTHRTITNTVERAAARRILRARGMATSEVHRMSYSALSAALGPVSDEQWDAVMAWASRSQSAPVESAPVSQPDKAPVSNSDQSRESESPDENSDPESGPAPSKDGKDGKPSKSDGKSAGKVPKPEGGPVDALEARVRQIIAEAMEEAPPPLDKSAVTEAVQEALKDAVRPLQITVKIPDAPETTTPEGSTAHYMTPEVVQCLASGVHAWLPGPAGSGKSTLARQALHLLGYTDDDIFMTGAIETPFELKGYRSPHNDPETLLTPLRRSINRARETGKGAFIMDDIDRSNPKALAAFNELLANGHASFPDGMVQIPPGWLCIATANTYGLGGGVDYVGAARLDKATLDRFAFIEIPYDEAQELAIAGPAGAEWCTFVQRVRKACKKLGLKHLVTPRATYKGLKLLAAGMKREMVEKATVYAGLEAETVARVKGAM